VECLKNVVLDIENGKISINDVVLPRISYFKLEFTKGRWRLSMNENLFTKVDLSTRVDEVDTATIEEQQFRALARGKRVVPNN